MAAAAAAAGIYMQSTPVRRFTEKSSKMFKFVSIFIAHPQISSLCISLLETRRSVMTGLTSSVIEEKERPQLSSTGSWLIYLTLAECNLLLHRSKTSFFFSYHQMIKYNVVL